MPQRYGKKPPRLQRYGNKQGLMALTGWILVISHKSLGKRRDWLPDFSPRTYDLWPMTYDLFKDFLKLKFFLCFNHWNININYAENKIRGFQRWGYRDYHNNHGAGIENSTWCIAAGFGSFATQLHELYSEFYLYYKNNKVLHKHFFEK